MLFLHGFPEGAFVWDALMQRFAQPEHGGFRCVAPNLRGFEKSSAPAEAAAYKPAPMVQDIMALAAQEGVDGRIHTWSRTTGAAPSPGAPRTHADRIERLVIINSPHPGTFARELKNNPAQQQASAYMHFLARPDAEALLAADDYRRLWPFFTTMGVGAEGHGWLTEAVRQQYRDVWDQGLAGGCNLYRVTPLKPPLPGRPRTPSRCRRPSGCGGPTLVLWAMEDKPCCRACWTAWTRTCPAHAASPAGRHALGGARAAGGGGGPDRGFASK
jgi:pimeloyl-ACP methyl ester carboxylesterase